MEGSHTLDKPITPVQTPLGNLEIKLRIQARKQSETYFKYKGLINCGHSGSSSCAGLENYFFLRSSSSSS